MRYESVLSALENLNQRGMNFGLERTRSLLAALSNPDKKLKIIHIAGSNGKGSVAEYMTRILIAAGKSVGTFTSPAVYDYSEQFKINGVNISNGKFTAAAQDILPLAERLGATRFETETAIALNLFVQNGCEYAVVECGLGGTYDATNAISGKKLALITSISLEHTAILGNDIKSICNHKAGIIKDCPAIVSGYNPPEVLQYFKDLGAKIAGKYETPPLFGEAQKYNCALAIEGAKLLNIDEAAIYSGVNRAKLCGRVEVITARDATYVLDGAHNPAAFKPLCEFLKTLGGEKIIIFGCLSDKDIDGNLKMLAAHANKIIAVQPESPRAMPSDGIYAACKRHFGDVSAAENVGVALQRAGQNTVVVCGSFTLLKEAKSWIEKRL